MNRRVDAIAAFERTLKLRPDFPEVRLEVASLQRLEAAVEAALRGRSGHH